MMKHVIAAVLVLVTAGQAFAIGYPNPRELADAIFAQKDPISELKERASDDPTDPQSRGCVSCHEGSSDPHSAKKASCVGCHGGNASIHKPAGSLKGTSTYDDAKKLAHVQPAHPEWWPSSANPERTYTKLLR